MDAETVAQLVDSLASNDRNERAQAAIELGQNQVADALPLLRKLTAHPDGVTALASMYACWCLGKDQFDASRILEAVTSGDEALTQQAVETVCAIGKPLVAKLAPHLKRSHQEAIAALNLMEEIGGTEARRAIEDLENPDPRVTDEAKEILATWEGDED